MANKLFDPQGTQCQSEIKGHCPCSEPAKVHTRVEWLGQTDLCLSCYLDYLVAGYCESENN